MTDKQPPEKHGSGYQSVIEQIRQLVVDGELHPGDRLPPERILAQSFGVTRSVVRQALQALGERGIVESRQGDGTYLMAEGRAIAPVAALLREMLRSGEDLPSILEFRQLIEPQIAALAAERITPDQLDKLKVVLCDQQNALLQGKPVQHLDAEFHRLLTLSTANPVLCQVMETVRSVVDQTRSAWLQSRQRALQSVEGHLHVIQALETGDAQAAYTAMQRHIAQVETSIMGCTPEDEEQRE